jgi:hypothetical protein
MISSVYLGAQSIQIFYHYIELFPIGGQHLTRK